MLKNIIKNILKNIIYLFNSKNIGRGNDFFCILQEFKSFAEKNKDIKFRYKLYNFVHDVDHACVGVKQYNKTLVFVPNDINYLFIISDTDNERYDLDNVNKFKWTGGSIYKESLYCFPRSANKILQYNFLSKKINSIEVDAYININGDEHHYGGIVLENGVMIQPPRNSNYIFIYNINTKEEKKIKICPSFMSGNFRYSAIILHPNGFIYLIPENGKVIKMNSSTYKRKFIGKSINPMVYDLKVLPDGNIYGYSAYKKGLLKIDVYRDTVTMIMEDYPIFSYNSKLGFDGCLYSCPGRNNSIWKYDCYENTIKKVAEIQELSDCMHYAGGCTTTNGNIVCSPIKEKNFLVLEFDIITKIDMNIFNIFYLDNY